MGYRVFEPLNSTCRESGLRDVGLGAFLPLLACLLGILKGPLVVSQDGFN
jgi:hypothetical protein